VIDADLRRLRKRARKIARPRLHYFLHWLTWHALTDAGAYGRPLFDTRTMELATTAIRQYLDRVADRGAFLYFGIRDRRDLGSVPIELRQVTPDGGVALEVEPITDAILGGGRYGAGWREPGELSIEDLAR
jgi:hypothetical protein